MEGCLRAHKKVAFVFVLAVLAPSLILAWLAVRSLRDQQLVLERQQSLLCQSVADAAAKTCGDRLLDRKRDFGLELEKIFGAQPPMAVASDFDDSIRRNWSVAEVGFAVSLDGTIYSPSLFGRAESRRFRLQNDRFLSSHEPVEVFYTGLKGNMNPAQLDAKERAATSNNPAAAGNKLLSEVWGYNYYGTTRTLDQVIVQLRKKLNDPAERPRHLLTVHGVGYKLLLG